MSMRALRPAVGRIARCRRGIDGFILGRTIMKEWIGVRVSDPTKSWQSRFPTNVRRAVIIADRRKDSVV